MTTYTYRGDRLTDDVLRSKTFTAVLKPNGKCITGGSKMLVQDATGRRYVVLRNQLRKVRS